ncbi:MBL fold metallo-hydrolase [Paenibacillus sp. y28]|uniref:MBL fold metallo-hydrolase n=1 Tax=Paenibacillus sp. y28 TaxID=3129110 RepID=UPI003018ADB3
MRVVQELTVHQITFFPRVFPVNCYFVEEENSLTLIDAALPFSAPGIIAAADRIGKPITRIVLTHAHDDHVGALDALKQALPDAAVYISKRDARLLAGDRGLMPSEPQMPIRGGVPKHVKTRPDVLLHDGEQLGSLQAIAAPGHTPGSMAFLDTRNGALIAGDAFQTRGGIAVSGQLRPWFPFPAWATWNKALALDSARKLLALAPSLLAIGHGRLLASPAPWMIQAIAAAEQRLALQPR